ncbi:hypothetical protein HLV37_02370 [Eggerthellaceae bacterium zg-1084]|uniref:Uncharacterized protein n=1 Tax=Berryella wangjianweii TaxID=2734634 RepID=A0A6M8J4L8_9ACTN|nr:hypothetical protein [Berryella wangjianweii]NPD30725.1 hypothetical protein [Berryella wangjianweii]NPD32056.1 hypothetical protein [Eggerthellaceae bacterium zg-997]QKF06678.1 hypothetical protein HLV38_03935 [Berryella wangjianweii]
MSNSIYIRTATEQLRRGALALTRASASACVRAQVTVRRLRASEQGQGTTEYAILVGVLVVIAIIAIVALRPKLQELWDAIAQGMGQL